MVAEVPPPVFLVEPASDWASSSWVENGWSSAEGFIEGIPEDWDQRLDWDCPCGAHSREQCACEECEEL